MNYIIFMRKNHFVHYYVIGYTHRRRSTTGLYVMSNTNVLSLYPCLQHHGASNKASSVEILSQPVSAHSQSRLEIRLQMFSFSKMV